MSIVRPVDRKRWRRALIGYVEDFPRQLEALRFSTQQIGERFDQARFEEAFASDDPAVYTHVQAIERGFGRLQNYMAGMAEAGARLAELPRRSPTGRESRAQPDFEALRDAKVISRDACRRLVAAQRSRGLLEHEYIQVSATDLHAAVEQILEIAPGFLDRFSTWIEPYLTAVEVDRPRR